MAGVAAATMPQLAVSHDRREYRSSLAALSHAPRAAREGGEARTRLVVSVTVGSGPQQHLTPGPRALMPGGCGGARA